MCKKIYSMLTTDTRTKSLASFWCLYCWFWTYFTHYLGISIVESEQVDANLVQSKSPIYDQPNPFSVHTVTKYCTKTSSEKYLVTLLVFSYHISPVISQKSECRNGCYKKTKHATFSEKRLFLTPWYAHAL